jgi:hypothetical protein
VALVATVVGATFVQFPEPLGLCARVTASWVFDWCDNDLSTEGTEHEI